MHGRYGVVCVSLNLSIVYRERAVFTDRYVISLRNARVRKLSPDEKKGTPLPTGIVAFRFQTMASNACGMSGIRNMFLLSSRAFESRDLGAARASLVIAFLFFDSFFFFFICFFCLSDLILFSFLFSLIFIFNLFRRVAAGSGIWIFSGIGVDVMLLIRVYILKCLRFSYDL